MLVYWYMGGGVILNVDVCYVFCLMILKIVKCLVVLVDYCLVLQYKFLVGLEDCIFVYEWILKNVESFGVLVGCVVIGGDSMGGNFSVIIVQELIWCGMLKFEL